MEPGQPLLGLSGGRAARYSGQPPAKQRRMQSSQELHSQRHSEPPAEVQVPQHDSTAMLGHVRQNAAPQSAASQPVAQRSSAPNVMMVGLHAGMPSVRSAQSGPSQQPALQRCTSSQARQPSPQLPLATQVPRHSSLQQQQQVLPQQQRAVPGAPSSSASIIPTDRLPLQQSQTQLHSSIEDAEPTRTSQPHQLPQVNMPN